MRHSSKNLPGKSRRAALVAIIRSIAAAYSRAKSSCALLTVATSEARVASRSPNSYTGEPWASATRSPALRRSSIALGSKLERSYATDLRRRIVAWSREATPSMSAQQIFSDASEWQTTVQ